MGSLWNQIYIVTHDEAGRESTNFLSWQDQSEWSDASIDLLKTRYQAITDTAVVGVQVVKTKLYGTTPSSGPYNTAFDRATLFTKFADKVSGHVDVVGPKSDIFDASHQFVNMSDARVIAFVSSLIAVVGNSAGSAVAAVPRGTRTRVHPQMF